MRIAAANQLPHRSDPDTGERCYLCATSPGPGPDHDHDRIDGMAGWRWFSNGRGGLHAVCPSCPTPNDLLSQQIPLLEAA